MKRLSLLFTLIISYTLYAQETKVLLLNETSESLVIRYSFGDSNFESYSVNGLETFKPSIEDGTPILEFGAPDLQKVSHSVQIPAGAIVTYEVIEENYEDIENITVTPSKGNLYRDQNPNKVPYVFGKHYEKDQWYPKSQVSIQSEYQIRNVHGRALWVYPFRVLPAQNTLRVYKDITIKINIEGGEKEGLSEVNNRSFNKIYQDHFINYSSTKYDLVSEEGKMLILSHPDFMDAIIPFSQWKTQLGIENEIVDVSTIGGSAEIKDYVQNYYNTNGLTYLLLVGDHQQIPADNLSAGYSDNSYSYVAGSDHYPDLFVGRFSAETSEQVEVMVNRTIAYEMNPTMDNSYNRAVGIGSEDGTSSTDPDSGNTGMGDDNEADWHHNMNIKQDLLDFTYSSVYELYEGGPYTGSIDAAGNPSATDLEDIIKDGLGLINYTGHGSSEEFVTTGFDNDNVDGLTNTDVFPFIFSVACVNGEFMNTTCFAEKWLRATDEENNPTGAIAALMSTINQSWNPPMSGQDEMNDILTEQYEDNIRRSFGAISMQGCMKMNDDYGDAGAEMTDTWLLFGDPSVVVRTAQPTNITSSHEEVLPIGSNTFIVNADVENAIVAMSYQDELIAEAIIENGQAVLNFDPILEVGVYTVTVSAFNGVPTVSEIQSIVLEGSYVIGEEFDLTDIADGNDGHADYGDSLLYNIALENVGVENTTNLSILVSSNNPFITIVNPSITMGEINSGDISWANESLSVLISDSIPNGENIQLNIEVSDTLGNVWNTTSNIEVNAPEFNVAPFAINDALGNGNGLMEVGESFSIDFLVENIGGTSSEDIAAVLSTASPYLLIEESSVEIDALDNGVNTMVSFICSLSENTPVATEIDFSLNLNSGFYNYEFNSSYITSICEVGALEVSLNLLTDYYSTQESSMTLSNSEGYIYESFETGELESDYDYNLSYCIEAGTIMEFELSDNYGDGINAGGSYSITVCGQEIISGGDESFYTLEESFIVSCDQSSFILGCMDEDALNYNPLANYDDGSCIEVIEGCTDNNAINFDAAANVDDGSCEYTLSCDEGYNEVYISITTDEYGEETSWTLETSTGELIASVGVETYENESTYNSAYCVEETAQVTFTITDSYGDGLTEGDGYFTLTVCNNVLLEGADFGSEDQITFIGCEVYNVSLEEINTSNWTVYPNPNNGNEFWIDTNEKSSLHIYNVLGEMIYSSEVLKGDNKINIPGLDTGVYYLKLDAGSVKKMIVH